MAWQTDHRVHSPYPLRHNGTNVHIVEQPATRRGSPPTSSCRRSSTVCRRSRPRSSTGACDARVSRCCLAELEVVLDTMDSDAVRRPMSVAEPLTRRRARRAPRSSARRATFHRAGLRRGVGARPRSPYAGHERRALRSLPQQGRPPRRRHRRPHRPGPRPPRHGRDRCARTCSGSGSRIDRVPACGRCWSRRGRRPYRPRGEAPAPRAPDGASSTEWQAIYRELQETRASIRQSTWTRCSPCSGPSSSGSASSRPGTSSCRRPATWGKLVDRLIGSLESPRLTRRPRRARQRRDRSPPSAPGWDRRSRRGGRATRAELRDASTHARNANMTTAARPTASAGPKIEPTRRRTARRSALHLRSSSCRGP